MRFLIIDDNPSDRDLIIEVLRRSGLEIDSVDSVKTCAEAMLAFDHKYECILIDHMLMVGVEGLECVKEIRGSGFVGVLVLLTGYQDETLALKAIPAGADDFVYKDAMFDKLATVINNALERRKDGMDLHAATKETEKALDNIGKHLDEIGKRIEDE